MDQNNISVCLSRLPRSVILWGGTGQAKVARPIIEHFGSKVVAVFDDTPGLQSPFPDIGIHLGWDGFQNWVRGRNCADIGFCIAIGNPHGRVRISLHERLESEGLLPVTVAHPGAQIADNAVVGAGCQIMAGAVVNPEAKLGRQCIINTHATVDHEALLADGCEVAPGATLCGLVKMGVNAWVCAGATVLPRLEIGADAIVGAGAVVTQSVAPGVTVVGIPARPIKKKRSN